MKLEYLENTGDELYDCLIRLFDFSSEELKDLESVIQDNVIKNGKEITLSELDFIETVNCDLKLRLSTENVGIVQLDAKRFSYEMRKDGFVNMIEKIQNSTLTEGYFWLDNNCDGEISLLLSEGGGW
jgi:hypothetical protein